MNHKFIKLFTILSGPFLAIDFAVDGSFANYKPTAEGGLLNFIYMTGWMLNIIALFKMHNNARPRVKLIFLLQLAFLFLANVSNVWSMIEPGSQHRLFIALDLFWPISNAFMMATGFTVLRLKRIKGWQRFVPLLVGLWLPAALVLKLLMGERQVVVFLIGVYSAVAWSILGLSVSTRSSEYREQAVLARDVA